MVDHHSIWSKVAGALAAAVIGGGVTTIVDNKITNIKQEAQIEQLVDLKKNVQTLNTGLSEANINLAIFSNQLRNVREELHEQSNRQPNGYASRDGSEQPRGRD